MMEKGLEEKTGKSLSHWISVVEKSGVQKHKEIINYLKSEHGFTYGYANFVAHKTRKSDAGSQNDDDLLVNQYKGKEALQPIYDKIVAYVSTLGNDVTITPKKTSVSIIRKKQFALIKPATKTRIDLGLKLVGKEITERLENSGPFGTMCTHRVRMTDASEVDDELCQWLSEAYEKGQ